MIYNLKPSNPDLKSYLDTWSIIRVPQNEPAESLKFSHILRGRAWSPVLLLAKKWRKRHLIFWKRFWLWRTSYNHTHIIYIYTAYINWVDTRSVDTELFSASRQAHQRIHLKTACFADNTCHSWLKGKSTGKPGYIYNIIGWYWV